MLRSSNSSWVGRRLSLLQEFEREERELTERKTMGYTWSIGRRPPLAASAYRARSVRAGCPGR